MKEMTVTISGEVQGVGFRAFTQKQADKIGGIYGFVHNAVDGTVEVVAQGEEEDLKKLLSYLKRGPYFAEVEYYDVEWHDRLQDEFTDFTIER